MARFALVCIISSLLTLNAIRVTYGGALEAVAKEGSLEAVKGGLEGAVAVKGQGQGGGVVANPTPGGGVAEEAAQGVSPPTGTAVSVQQVNAYCGGYSWQQCSNLCARMHWLCWYCSPQYCYCDNYSCF